VLCSDGLSDEVGPQDIVQILAPYPPIEHAAQQLVDLANARGGHDNITVILIRFPGGVPFAAPSAGGHATPTATLAAAPVAQTTTAEMEILQPGAVAAAVAATPAPPSVQPIPASAVPPPQFTPPPAYAPTPAEMTAAPKRGRGLIVAIVVVILLAAVGIGAAMFLRVKEDARNNDTPSSASIDDDDTPPPTTTKSAVKPVPIPQVSVPEPSTPSPRPSQSGAPQPTKSTGSQVPTVKPTVTSPPPESTVKE
jgi:protein phosphatase